MNGPIYLSGGMTGLPDYNYPAFNAEAARLRALGHVVENPAENPEQDSWQAYMRVAIAQMMRCESVAFLPGWEESKGACIESDLAVQLGMPRTMACRIRTGPTERAA